MKTNKRITKVIIIILNVIIKKFFTPIKILYLLIVTNLYFIISIIKKSLNITISNSRTIRVKHINNDSNRIKINFLLKFLVLVNSSLLLILFSLFSIFLPKNLSNIKVKAGTIKQIRIENRVIRKVLIFSSLNKLFTKREIIIANII